MVACIQIIILDLIKRMQKSNVAIKLHLYFAIFPVLVS